LLCIGSGSLSALQCPFSCGDCESSTITITVDGAQGDVKIKNCTTVGQTHACDTMLGSVVPNRAESVVSNCYNHCKITVTPVAGKVWNTVVTCADLTITCEHC
jgi:hypothetical protein